MIYRILFRNMFWELVTESSSTYFYLLPYIIMETNFTMQEFNPTVIELTNLSESYKWLKINWIDDKEWYEIVKRAQLDLRDKRVSITKLGKSMRDAANEYNRKVLEKEKELIWIIEDTEKELKSERERIDNQIEIERRKKILPFRIKQLEDNYLSIPEEEFLLSMDADWFDKYVLNQREQRIIDAERKAREEQEEKIRKENEEKIRKEAVEKAIKETEDRIIREQKEKELKDKQLKEQEEKRKLDEQKKIEANKKYQKWLSDNSFNEAEYMIVDFPPFKKVMFKKVSEYIV